MTTETALAVVDESRGAVVAFRWNREQIELLKTTVAKDTTDDEFALFGEVCRRTELDPFTKQIHCVVRGKGNNRSVSFQTGIDGYRLIAVRTGQYQGQHGPFWCGEDGVWRDVWLSAEPPSAAKVGVIRLGFTQPVWGVATYTAYVQTRGVWENGQKVGTEVNDFWARMPDVMLAKCAEALALRKAFPQELSGIYTIDEMGQADNEGPAPSAPRPAAAQVEAPKQGSRGQAREAMRSARPAPSPAKTAPPQQAAAAPQLETWIAEVKTTLEGWEYKLSALATIVGGPVTPRVIKEWARLNVPEGQDPVKALLTVFRKEVLEPEEAARRAGGVTPDGEIIEGEVMAAEEAVPEPDPDDAPLE